MEEVLRVVESIPPGRAMSYGAIADHLSERSGRNSARLVGNIMARHGGSVPWHRVVNSAGRFPRGHEVRAAALHRAERTPLKPDGVDMRRAAWSPAD